MNRLTIFYVVFSLTSAVTTSLQYTVSNQLFEKDQIEQGYIFHVIITSLGSIIGPVVGGKRKLNKYKRKKHDLIFFLGLCLDITKSYKSVILTSMIFLLISFISFGITILLSEKKKVNESEQNQISTL